MNTWHDPERIEEKRTLRDPQQIEEISKLIKNIEQEEDLNYSIAKNAVEKLNKIIKQDRPEVEAKCYGSFASQLALRTSTINIQLVTETFNKHKLLHEIKAILQDFSDFSVTLEEKTSTKRAKLCVYERINGTICDIQISGLKTSSNFAHLLKALWKYDVRVRPLLIAIRRWAEICEVHESDDGGLHPLCYILMVIHFLQQRKPPVLPIVRTEKKEELDKLRKDDTSIGELWLELLRYYSQFDWDNWWISITKANVNKGVYELKGKEKKHERPGGHALMTIEDPFIPDKNLAKSVTKQDMKNLIQNCFKHTYEYFCQPDGDHPDDDETDSGFCSDAKCSSDNERIRYSFHVSNFMPETEAFDLCEACEELGTTCKECGKQEQSEAKIDDLPKMTTRFANIIDKSLKDMYTKHSLPEKKINGRKAFVEDLEKHIRKRYPMARLELIGSSVNGFGFVDSDLDICMTFDGIKEKDIFNKYKILNEVRFHLHKINISAIIIYSKIPIIKFEQVNTKFTGDISWYNTLALYNSKLLHTYSLIDERAKILGCAMKLLAKNGDIADSANKTLSSYSYILMVIHFLQQTDPSILPVLQELGKSKKIPEEIVNDLDVSFFKDLEHLEHDSKGNKDSAGRLWVNFLDYYVKNLTNENFFVSIRQKTLLNESENHLKKVSPLFNIEDPFILTKNLGCVVSDKTAAETRHILRRARNLFGKPIYDLPKGFKDWSDFFFNRSNLTGKILYPQSKVPEKSKTIPNLTYRNNQPRYNRNQAQLIRSPKSQPIQKASSIKNNVQNNCS